MEAQGKVEFPASGNEPDELPLLYCAMSGKFPLNFNCVTDFNAFVSAFIDVL